MRLCSCRLLGDSFVVTTYSFVTPLDGCDTALAHEPANTYSVDGTKQVLQQAVERLHMRQLCSVMSVTLRP